MIELLKYTFLLMLLTGTANAQEVVHIAHYTIGVGDKIAITVYGEEDMSGTVTVDADGTANFPLIGPVPVSGFTTSEIDASLLTILAADYLRNPAVRVNVAEYGSKRVKVYGPAKHSEVILRADTVLLDALLASAGVEMKEVAEVWVRHQGEDTETVVNIDRLLSTGEGNIAIKGGDTIHLPTDQVVYVSGEVKKTSPIPFREGLTVTQAITRAGGLNELASTRGAYILRDNKKIKLKLNKIIDGEREDVVLMLGDQLVIPTSVF
jgi:protein involved in polysaccharide export with SLBB domain